ncbi:MAG: hypothetical protein II272_09020 [Oscillospiraceae bacterium]|jgi:predicted RNA-binding Zn-ribbon protein involved in translation (DUF1610 family)|nr:hypothetical protein [Oscillospiraceae bacterium]
MRQRVKKFFLLRRERIGIRLRYGRQRRFFRCPACRFPQSVPIGRGQSKLVCPHCGEIFLRRT